MDGYGDNYNYATFVSKTPAWFERFKTLHPVGTVAPDFPLEDLETGETVQLKELWRKGMAVVEFGSFS